MSAGRTGYDMQHVCVPVVLEPVNRYQGLHANRQYVCLT